MVINSKPEQVVFENGKAVLMLPTLKPFLWLIENSTKDGKITQPDFEKHIWKFKDFHSSLLKVFNNLECGFYRFEWYFYIYDLIIVYRNIL